jgi:hypothetical protein
MGFRTGKSGSDPTLLHYQTDMWSATQPQHKPRYTVLLSCVYCHFTVSTVTPQIQYFRIYIFLQLSWLNLTEALGFNDAEFYVFQVSQTSNLQRGDLKTIHCKFNHVRGSSWPLTHITVANFERSTITVQVRLLCTVLLELPLNNYRTPFTNDISLLYKLISESVKYLPVEEELGSIREEETAAYVKIILGHFMEIHEMHYQ